MSLEIQSLDHLVLTVRDLQETIAFYTDVLGLVAQQFTPSDGTERTALCFGRQKINLHQAGAEFDPKADSPCPGSADLCFLTQVPVEKVIAHLSATNTKIIDGPVARTGATGPLVSVYLRDPDGNLIEVSNKV